MPELPEVETVRRGLQPHVEGRVIASVVQRRPDLRFPLPKGLAKRLSGRRVTRLDRRAKYLLFQLDDGMVLVVHLGMTGRFIVQPTADAPTLKLPAPETLAHPPAEAEKTRLPDGPGPHDHVDLVLADSHDGPAAVTLVFNDIRRFGYMLLLAEAERDADPHFVGLGPEPLGNTFSGPVLGAALAKRMTPIKAALLDQRVVAGLGNIYVCEALHQAQISPRRMALNVQGARADRLVAAIRDVLTRALEAGGSSLRDFRHADGTLGYFQHRFRAYGRAGEPCPHEGCGGTIQRIVQSGRSTFYCNRCQR